MRAIVESCRSRGPLPLVLIALIASGLAACSSDATRFGDSPLSNPYASRPPANNNVASTQPAPNNQVDTRPLPPPTPEVTGSVTRDRNWDWDGGTAITVAPGDTIASIARKHHVPAAVIMPAK